MSHPTSKSPTRSAPWNKANVVGQKPPLKLREIWAIRIRLQLAGDLRDLALFNLAIDSKLRACDLVQLLAHLPLGAMQGILPSDSNSPQIPRT